MTATILAGAHAWSHVADGHRGALVIHGFTSNPASMRGVAEAFAGTGYHVELPRLPGHGTSIEDMLTTSWADWSGEAEAAYQRLTSRASAVVVVGLSMGGSLALWIAGRHPEVHGLVCINPAAMPQAQELIAMLQGMVDEGTLHMPGIGSDIADPDSRENAYDGTPVPCMLSLVADGLASIAPTYEALRMPLMLMVSAQDHVLEPAHAEFLATHYGGPLERVVLERSYHVATQDYDRDLIEAEAVAFANRVTA